MDKKGERHATVFHDALDLHGIKMKHLQCIGNNEPGPRYCYTARKRGYCRSARIKGYNYRFAANRSLCAQIQSMLDMHRLRTILSLFAFFLVAVPVRAQNTAGGQSGYDTTLVAIEPTGERVSISLAGADPADIDRYIQAANGGVGGGRLSPDGKTVAFRWSITGIPQLWVMDVIGGQPKQLTFGNGIQFFRWMPDGEGLLYGADNNGDEQEAYYVIQLDGTSERLVFPASEGGFRVFGGFQGDTGAIVFASTERNQLDFDIYVGTLEAGTSRMVYQGTYGFFANDSSPDGQYAIVTETVGEDSDNLYLLDLETGEMQTLSAPERRANHSNGGFAWTDDSEGFYLSSNTDRNYAALMHYSRTDGFKVIEEADGDIHNVRLCGVNDRYLTWTLNEGGYSKLFAKDLSSNVMLDLPALPEGVYGLQCTNRSSRLLVNVNGWRTPGSVFVVDLADLSRFDVFVANLAGLDPDRLIRPESITMPARDGVQLQGLLYLPDASSRKEAGPPPVIFSVHGGPTGQSRPTFDATVQYHLDRGIAVFEPNVRGSTGFGHTYVTLDDREHRLDSVRDLVDMLAFLKADGRVDGSRAVVMGGSYGGYAVNAVLANFPGHFIAGVSLFGVADWVNALEIASPALKASDRIEYGDITEPRWQKFYKENSPINQADQISVPVLYSHGVRDPRVDISETEVMVRTLRKNGIEAPFIRFLDEGHGWRKLSNRLFYARRQAEFLEQQLGLDSAPLQ